jgi:hypothetical protein
MEVCRNIEFFIVRDTGTSFLVLAMVQHLIFFMFLTLNRLLRTFNIFYFAMMIQQYTMDHFLSILLCLFSIEGT